MPLQNLRLELFLLVAIARISGAASANTYTVGPGPGANFPDLPTAIAASQAGDVLLVQAASYASGFTLDKGLTIIGYGGVQILGEAVIANVPNNQRAAIVHLAVVGCTVDHCAGPVVIQEITTSGALAINTCTDVRLLQVISSLPPLPTAACLMLAGSRVELVQSSFSGSDAGASGTYGGADGGLGIVCQAGSRINLVFSSAIGGGGQLNAGAGQYAGDGAAGFQLYTGDQLIIAASSILAGVGGYGFDPLGTCCYDGNGTIAVWNDHGSQTWYSGANIVGTNNNLNCTACSYFQWGPFADPNLAMLVSPADPTLTVSGTFTPLTTSTLSLNGPAGAHAVPDIGRRAILVPDPNMPERIESLVGAARSFDLGVIPASGTVIFTLYDQAWPPGTFLAAQATIRLTAGGFRRTNSVPMVFR